MSFYCILSSTFRLKRSLKLVALGMLAAVLVGCASGDKALDSSEDYILVSQGGVQVEQPETDKLEMQEQARQDLRLADQRVKALQQRRQEAENAKAQALSRAEEALNKEKDTQLERAAEAAMQVRVQQQQETELKEQIKSQQTEVARLEAQIEVNNEVTGLLDTANTVLKESIGAADNLSSALSAEEEKYDSVDLETGLTSQALNKLRLEELEVEFSRLKAQAAQLTREAR